MNTINQIHVANMTSSSGNDVPNQFIIDTPDGMYFQSYNSMIVFKSKDGNTYLDEQYWDYSKTTGKYRNMFLHENKAETEKKIKNGEYLLVDLNK